jgi:hypothetical protein
MGRGGAFITLARLSVIAGQSPSRVAMPSGQGERKAWLLERIEKSALYG